MGKTSLHKAAMVQRLECLLVEPVFGLEIAVSIAPISTFCAGPSGADCSRSGGAIFQRPLHHL